MVALSSAPMKDPDAMPKPFAYILLGITGASCKHFPLPPASSTVRSCSTTNLHPLLLDLSLLNHRWLLTSDL